MKRIILWSLFCFVVAVVWTLDIIFVHILGVSLGISLACSISFIYFGVTYLTRAILDYRASKR